MSDRKRFPLGAEGPFYVLYECCTACEVPLTEAPDLMAMHESDDPNEFGYHCYFKRQPETDAELQRAINAMHVQDLGCIRYGGSDSSVLSRLTSLELDEHCDELEPKRDA